MLPRAPKQTYIDVYPDEERFDDDINQQSNYMAEVSVYRALEKLDIKNTIVLHSFEYTHHQYRLCDKNHIRKGCSKCKAAASKDGECDFLVMTGDRFVVIEVKNMVECRNIEDCELEFHLCTIGEEREEPECMTGKTMDEQLRALNGTFEKSVKQRKKVVDLIKSIDKNVTVLEFTAYPFFNKRFEEQFKHPKKSSIIYHDDIYNPSYWYDSDYYIGRIFGKWWERALGLSCIQRYNGCKPENDELFERYERVRNILLAIWCTDRDICDQQRCSLGWTITQTYEKLRSGQFVFRKNNPYTVPAPRIIKEHLGVENVTKEQFDVLASKKKFLWINGPAGAGKSLILAGRMIKLVQSNKRNKVVLFRFCGEGNNSRLYEKALESAGIKYNGLITEVGNDNQVTLVTLTHASISRFTETISKLKNCSLFVDDAQALLPCPIQNENFGALNRFFETLLSLKSSVDNIVVVCDVVQTVLGVLYSGEESGYYVGYRRFAEPISKLLGPADAFNKMLEENHFESLSSNLRNSFDISAALNALREMVISFNMRPDYSDTLIPDDDLGHVIFGPSIVIHVFDNGPTSTQQYDSVENIIEHELDLLCGEGGLDLSDIVINDNCPKYDSCKLLKEIKKEIPRTSYAAGTFSSEYPAVIVLHEMVPSNGEAIYIESLYLAISRALVYCVVIMFHDYGSSETLYTWERLFLDKIRDYSLILRHYNSWYD